MGFGEFICAKQSNAYRIKTRMYTYTSLVFTTKLKLFTGSKLVDLFQNLLIWLSALSPQINGIILLDGKYISKSLRTASILIVL